MAEYRNMHGRAWGRGIRPWLLIPKYLAVATAIGGLAAVIVIDRTFGTAEIEAVKTGRLIAAIFRFAIIPATIAAMALGVLLFLQHPRPFIRMRWMRIKLVIVLTVVPLAHLLLRSQVDLMQISPPAHITGPSIVALAGFVLIAVLGRLKPRLGQPIASQQA